MTPHLFESLKKIMELINEHGDIIHCKNCGAEIKDGTFKREKTVLINGKKIKGEKHHPEI